MTLTNKPTTRVHIDTIRVGDTVHHNGKDRTVCGQSLRHIKGMGMALWGDTYAMGTKPVERLDIRNAWEGYK